MTPFQHVSDPLRIFGGDTALPRLGRELARLGCQRAVVPTGRTLSRSPLADRLVQAGGGRVAGVLAAVLPHSPRAALEAATREVAAMGADALIAFGGGSAVVTARAVAIFLAEGTDLEKLSTQIAADGSVSSPRLTRAKLPLFAVPTTPNTAMVKAGAAVHDESSGRRFALYDPKTRAQAIFLDPDCLASAPLELVRSASLDSFSLALEGYISPKGDPISDAQLLHALRLFKRALPLAQGAEARLDLAMAAILAGRGSDNSGGGVATVLGHALGAAHGLENGTVKAVLLPHVLRFNAAHLGDKLGELATALGCGPTYGTDQVNVGPVWEALSRWMAQLGLPARLRDLELGRESVIPAAEKGMEDWFLKGSPRPVHKVDELVSVLEAAW